MTLTNANAPHFYWNNHKLKPCELTGEAVINIETGVISAKMIKTHIGRLECPVDRLYARDDERIEIITNAKAVTVKLKALMAREEE